MRGSIPPPPLPPPARGGEQRKGPSWGERGGFTLESMNKSTSIILVFLILLVGACTTIKKPPTAPPVPPPKEMPPLAVVTGSDLPAFRDDLGRESLSRAIRKSLEYYARLPDRTLYRMGDRRFTLRDMKDTLEAFLEIIESGASSAVIEKRVRENFDVYRASGSAPSGRVIFTGYYEPVLKGSLKKPIATLIPSIASPTTRSLYNSVNSGKIPKRASGRPRRERRAASLFQSRGDRRRRCT